MSEFKKIRDEIMKGNLDTVGFLEWDRFLKKPEWAKREQETEAPSLTDKSSNVFRLSNLKCVFRLRKNCNWLQSIIYVKSRTLCCRESKK